MKPRLISNKVISFHAHWLVPTVSQYFDLVVDKDAGQIGPNDIIYDNTWSDLAITQAKNGKKVVIDKLWENKKCEDLYPCHVLHSWNWMWYQESLMYRYFNYHEYCARPDWMYHALLPMRRERPHRNFVAQCLGNKKDKFLWSYQARGRNLPNSGDPADPSTIHLNRAEWYDACAMSLVTETSCSDTPSTPEISEKTYKPMAFKHPFVICGDRGSLRFLQQLGFETFGHCFDESYDQIMPWHHRCKAAVDQCLNHQFQNNSYDSITQQKLQHNHAHFFNQELVIQKIKTEILEPLLDYAET